MPTDDERRAVARRLRGNPEDTLIPHRTGRHHGMGCREAADRFWNMCDRIKEAGNYDIAFSTTSILADLIEPSCDRDALLKLADEMDDARCDNYDELSVSLGDIWGWSQAIREALGGGGMTDHDYDLQAPMCEDTELEHVCSTCKHLEPCPCGCGWGMCRKQLFYADYVTGFDTCDEWEEA